eukprot:m.221512 g.221512  ORF g.221512 m.221512 type:complete len:56 (+) comp17012_c0_seq3:4463-4630(+)
MYACHSRSKRLDFDDLKTSAHAGHKHIVDKVWSRFYCCYWLASALNEDISAIPLK